jgi:hypothetical protein
MRSAGTPGPALARLHGPADLPTALLVEYLHDGEQHLSQLARMAILDPRARGPHELLGNRVGPPRILATRNQNPPFRDVC